MCTCIIYIGNAIRNVRFVVSKITLLHVQCNNNVMTWIHVCVYMYLSKDKITGLLIGCCFLVAGRLGRQRTICSMLLRLVVLSKSRDMDLNRTRHHHRYNHRLRWCVLIKILIFNDENVFSEKNVNEYKPKYKILLNFLRTCIYMLYFWGVGLVWRISWRGGGGLYA